MLQTIRRTTPSPFTAPGVEKSVLLRFINLLLVKGGGPDSLAMEGPFLNARSKDVASFFASPPLLLCGRHHPSIKPGLAATT
jgi:hypothetical protein